MAATTIHIRIREDGSIVVQRKLDDIGKTADKTSNSLDILKKALGALATVLAVDRLRRYADTWSDLNSRVRLSIRDHEDVGAVMGRLTRIARGTYSSLESTAEAFAQNSVTLRALGKSTEDQLRYTEALNNALVVSGAKADRAQTVQDNLSKALAQGSLSGLELNNVLNSGSRVAELLAEELGVNVTQLRALGSEGKITGDVIYTALVKNMETLAAEADSMPATVEDAFILIENGLLAAIGRFDEMTGASAMVADALIDVADNMELVTAGLLAMGAAVAVAFAPAAILKFTAAVRGLWLLLAANPFIALAAAIAGVVSFVALYGDEVNAGIDETTSLKDVLRAFVEEGGILWGELKDSAGSAFSTMLDAATGYLGSITGMTEDETQRWSDSYSQFYDGVGTGFAGVLRGIARTVDAITGLLMGLTIALIRVFGGLPTIFTEIFNRVYNSVMQRIEAIVNSTINGMNRLRSIVGKDPIELVNYERREVNERAFKEYGQNIAESFDIGFGAMIEGGFESRLNNVFDRAQRLSQQRLAAMDGSESDLSQAGAAPEGIMDPKEARELERLKNQYMSLLNTIDPIPGAKLAVAKAQDTLAQALQKGLITTEEYERYLERLDAHYEDILDPLGALNNELDEQTMLLGMNVREREIESQVLSYSQQLQKQGIDLTEEETEALRAKLIALRNLNDVVQEQDALLAGSVGQRQQFVDQIKAIQALLADTGSGFTSGDATNAMAAMNPDLFGFTQEMFDAQTERFAQMYEQIAMMREADLISEETAAAMRVKVWAMQQEQQLEVADAFFGNLAQLQKSENGKIAAIGKAAAISQAIINTYQSATAAFAAMAGIPYVGPALGAAAAAAAITAGMANVAQIRSQPVGFMTGGSFTVGGTGGADSQMVAFRASPGEQVSISTPTQVRKGDPAQQRSLQEGGREVTINQINNFNQPSDNRTENQRAAAAARKQRIAESRYGRAYV